MTTAAELLRSAQPPADDGLIDKAIADLDARIWEWTDALKSAHSQLRNAFAARPSARLSESLYESVPEGFSAARSPVQQPPVADEMPAGGPAQAAFEAPPAPEMPAVLPFAATVADVPMSPMPASLQAAAAAAHIPSPPPMPAEWTAPPAAAAATSVPLSSSPPPNNPASNPAWIPAHGGHGMSANEPSAPMPAAWPEPPAFRSEPSSGGVMQWPGASNSVNWPEPSGSRSSTGAQEWPTWTPADAKPKKTVSSAPKKAAKPSRPVVEGPTPEERAQKVAAEEAMLAQLEDAVARRVRLLRRLDPDTPIEKLVEKAKQGQAEAAAQAPAREDKSSSSWWRRK